MPFLCPTERLQDSTILKRLIVYALVVRVMDQSVPVGETKF